MSQSKQMLADALIELCEIKLLDDITVTEIADKCNITRQLFYYHFEDKYALAKWIHLRDNHASTFAQTGQIVDWEAYCRGFLCAVQKRKRFYQNLYHSRETKEFQRIMREYIYDTYISMLEKLTEEITEDMRHVLTVYCYGGAQFIYEWIRTGMTMPVDQMVHILFHSMPPCLQEMVLQYHEPAGDVLLSSP